MGFNTLNYCKTLVYNMRYKGYILLRERSYEMLYIPGAFVIAIVNFKTLLVHEAGIKSGNCAHYIIF